MESNRLVLSGVVVNVSPLRVSPGGIEQLQFQLRHCSRQQELSRDMVVEFEVRVVAVGAMARNLQQELRLSDQVLVEGFIDSAGYGEEQKKQLVLRAERCSRNS